MNILYTIGIVAMIIIVVAVINNSGNYDAVFSGIGNTKEIMFKSIVEYMGGIPGLSNTGPSAAIITNQVLNIGLKGEATTILLGNIKYAVLKTEEQIQNDVTLGRLLLVGILAFGLKKKTVNKQIYLLVAFELNGNEHIGVFGGENITNLASALNSQINYVNQNNQAWKAGD